MANKPWHPPTHPPHLQKLAAHISILSEEPLEAVTYTSAIDHNNFLSVVFLHLPSTWTIKYRPDLWNGPYIFYGYSFYSEAAGYSDRCVEQGVGSHWTTEPLECGRGAGSHWTTEPLECGQGGKGDRPLPGTGKCNMELVTDFTVLEWSQKDS